MGLATYSGSNRLFKTIRWKLTFWYAGLLAVILIILGVTLYQVLQHSLITEAINTVEARTRQISSFIETPEATNTGGGQGTFVDITDPDLINKFASEGVYIEIKNPQGKIVNLSPLLRKIRMSEGTVVSRLSTAGPGRLELVRVPEFGRMVVYTLPLIRNGHNLGTMTVGRSLHFVDETLAQLKMLLLFLSGGGLILAMVVGAALAKGALSPIDRITKAARQIGAKGLNQRLKMNGPDDEVTRLANAFDEMLDRLETAFQREKRFTADVSHELRTPLTIIKGTAEVALRAKNPRDYQEALATIDDEVDRMTNIINSLLTLARADAGQQQLEMKTMNLVDLVDSVYAAFLPIAAGKKIAFNKTATPLIEIRGDPNRLRQLLHNLIANALKYTPSGGMVTLSLAKDGAWAKIAVADTGIGIAEKDLPHIFDRFYRVDRARSRAEGGAGLGLSIAKWIVEAHGGRIEVKSEAGKGTIFTVWLPATD